MEATNISETTYREWRVILDETNPDWFLLKKEKPING